MGIQSRMFALQIQTARLISEVREFVPCQKEIWQTIPFLACEADGRTGFSDQLSRAYEQGYWAIANSATNGSYSVYVDLSNGELVDAYRPERPAQDRYVLQLVNHLDQLDAQAIVEDLNRLMQSERWPTLGPKTVTVESLGLGRVYTRDKHYRPGFELG